MTNMGGELIADESQTERRRRAQRKYWDKLKRTAPERVAAYADAADESEAGQVRKLRKAKLAVTRARDRYDDLKGTMSPEVVQAVEGSRDLGGAALDMVLERMDEEVRWFDHSAEQNANNVTRDRVKHFLTNCPEVQQALRNYVFSRGLTQWDMDAMIQQMHGNPKPIVIEPEPIRPLGYIDALDRTESSLDTDDDL